jgi:hypothetical protein
MMVVPFPSAAQTIYNAGIKKRESGYVERKKFGDVASELEGRIPSPAPSKLKSTNPRFGGYLGFLKIFPLL